MADRTNHNVTKFLQKKYHFLNMAKCTYNLQKTPSFVLKKNIIRKYLLNESKENKIIRKVIMSRVMQVYYHIEEMSSCSCDSNDSAFGPDKAELLNYYEIGRAILMKILKQAEQVTIDNKHYSCSCGTKVQ